MDRRLALLDILACSQHPMSLKQVAEKMPETNLRTLRRDLQRLANTGRIQI